MIPLFLGVAQKIPIFLAVALKIPLFYAVTLALFLSVLLAPPQKIAIFFTKKEREKKWLRSSWLRRTLLKLRCKLRHMVRPEAGEATVGGESSLKLT